jgi:hypothetical protein
MLEASQGGFGAASSRDAAPKIYVFQLIIRPVGPAIVLQC